MQLGIFAKTFERDTLEDNLDAVRAAGFVCTQYNMSCAGQATIPDRIPDGLCRQIRMAHAERDLTMAAISGTFNIIDSDCQRLEANMRSLETLAGACAELNVGVITLCSGTRDPENMWRRHPDNDTAEAWQDVVVAMRRIVRIAEQASVTVGIEPEVNNVVDSAVKARRILDELGSANVKIVMDGANVFHAGQLEHQRDVLDETFEHVGQDIVLAHAKDVSHDGDAGHEAAGTGRLDYPYYLGLLRQYGFDGPLITHGCTEEQVPQCVSFLRDRLASS